jgi:hypothetical protein
MAHASDPPHFANNGSESTTHFDAVALKKRSSALFVVQTLGQSDCGQLRETMAFLSPQLESKFWQTVVQLVSARLMTLPSFL